MKIVKKIGLILITVLLGTILTFNLYQYYCLKINHQDLAPVFGYAFLEVVSDSMEPVLHVGDIIIINTNAQEYHEGDIVTVYDEDLTFVTHRLTKIEEETITTKGDANASEDAPLPKNDLVGKYVYKLSGLGKILTSVKNPFVSSMIFILGILVCYIISTDKKGNPILEEEEFQEYVKQKNTKTKKITWPKWLTEKKEGTKKQKNKKGSPKKKQKGKQKAKKVTKNEKAMEK